MQLFKSVRVPVISLDKKESVSGSMLSLKVYVTCGYAVHFINGHLSHAV